MCCEFFVTEEREFNTNPAGVANIRWPIKLFWRLFDQSCLNTDSSGNYYGNVSIVVMVDRTHRKNSLTHEECRFAVRKFFHRLRQTQTCFPDTLHMFLS